MVFKAESVATLCGGVAELIREESWVGLFWECQRGNSWTFHSEQSDRIMTEFLRGRRRKIGCVTLVMACGLTLVWLRSDVIRDNIVLCPSFFRPQIPWYGEIVSLQGSLGWHRYQMESGNGGIGANAPVSLSSYSVQHYSGSSPRSEETLVWQRTWGAFRYGAGKTHVRGMSVQVWIIPYWAVVLILTLISAVLLLTRPLPSARARISPPKPIDGSM